MYDASDASAVDGHDRTVSPLARSFVLLGTAPNWFALWCRTGMYLVEDGMQVVMWIGTQVSPKFISALFGVGTLDELNHPTGELTLPVLESDINIRCRAIVDSICSHPYRYRLARPRYATTLRSVLAAHLPIACLQNIPRKGRRGEGVLRHAGRGRQAATGLLRRLSLQHPSTHTVRRRSPLCRLPAAL